MPVVSEPLEPGTYSSCGLHLTTTATTACAFCEHLLRQLRAGDGVTEHGGYVVGTSTPRTKAGYSIHSKMPKPGHRWGARQFPKEVAELMAPRSRCQDDNSNADRSLRKESK